jgi:hypothetical protein
MDGWRAEEEDSTGLLSSAGTKGTMEKLRESLK